jgi:uncharacterized protein YcgI (DUF1989 family)
MSTPPAITTPTSDDNPLLGRIARKAAQVRPRQAVVFDMRADQFLQITDVVGKQVANFIAFNRDDLEEYLSTSVTRAANNAFMLRVGDGLYSNRRNRMFTIVRDDVGRHDLLLPACDARRYLDDYGIAEHANCRDNFLRAMRDKGYTVADDHLPDPINWFMHVAIKARGELEIREPFSNRGDAVLLKAHMDTVFAVSACPQDQNASNAFTPTDVLVRVYA